MKLNMVDFSDDFYKGKTVKVNVNGSYFGKIEPLSDELILHSLDDDGNDVMVDYYNINDLINDLETMDLERLFVNGETNMSENDLKSKVLKGVAEFGMIVSDEDLDIIMGDVENWLTFTDCNVSEAIEHTLNYEDPWND